MDPKDESNNPVITEMEGSVNDLLTNKSESVTQPETKTIGNENSISSTKLVETPPPTQTNKVRKKRQSELAQILATQPVIQNTERHMSLTRRASICVPENTDSHKTKSILSKKKQDSRSQTSSELPLENTVQFKPQKPPRIKNKTNQNIEPMDHADESNTPLSELKVNKLGRKKKLTSEEQPPNELPSSEPSKLESAKPDETTAEEPPKNPTPKPKKKRRSELTQIIADQLLESFKEVDESQKDNLKILHDLSWADETMEIASRLKQSPIPRRQVTKKKPKLVDVPKKSPVIGTKASAAVTSEPAPIIETPIEKANEANREIPANIQSLDPPATKNDIPEINRSEAKLETTTTPMLKDPNGKPSLFETPVSELPLTILPKIPKQPTLQPDEISAFWKQNVEKEFVTEKRPNWISRAPEISKPSEASDDGKPGKPAATSGTFILKPSRLQAIASPPLVDAFDQLRNCDRSSTSSSFCSPVVSPIGEPKKSLLSGTLPPFAATVRSTASVLFTNPVVPPVNLLQFRELDDSDGDLEDNVSVHSSDSMESSMTSMTKSKAPRKRRKRSLLTKKKMRGQAAVKANKENGQSNAEKFHCEICNKTFEKADRLAKHKITLTHISRLSEIEFLNSQNAKVETETFPSVPLEVKLVLPDSIPLEPELSPQPQFVAVGTGAAVTPTPILVPNHHRSPLTPGPHINQSTLHNVQLEPISSPEQPQQSYFMSSSGGHRPDASFGAVMSNIPKRPPINVAGLSQEEKLFYECCNMLKGSDRVGTQSENNSLTPRSNEAHSTWYSKTSTAFAIRSPTSNNYHRQKSPKYAFPKLDLNQFSDISSDSENTYPMRAKPMNNGLGVVPGVFHNVVAAASHSNVGSLPAIGSVVSPLRREDPATYSDSDMGDSFPSAPGTSDNEHYVRTILDRTNNCVGSSVGGVRANEWKPNPARDERDCVLGESTDASSAAAVKFKTKAAMKGFDNFKVSIPTDGLNLNQALNGGVMLNPHMDSKLASLADIALRSSTLPLVETAISVLNKDQEGPKEQVVLNKDKTPEPEPEPAIEEEAVEIESIKTAKRSTTKTGRKVVQTRTDKNSVGNRLGFKAKKRKGSESNTERGSGRSSSTKNGLDVYDFDDSQGSSEAPILPMKKSAKPGLAEPSTSKEIADSDVKPLDAPTVVKPKGRGRPPKQKPSALVVQPVNETVKAPEQPQPETLDQSSIISSDSFSDRDDFNYNSPVVEDSDISSSQSTPVKRNPTPETAAVTKLTKKPPKKPLDNVQKKCLIMGRIFKNAQKNHKPDTIKPISIGSVSDVVAQPKKVEMDDLFDSLRQEEPMPVKQSKGIEGKIKPEKPEPIEKTIKSPQATGLKNGLKKAPELPKSILKKSEKKGKAKFVDEDDDDKETKKLIKELLNDDLGVGQRKSKRKCIQQVNFVETWSSDEYEEFHSTKDIIAMIEANEKRVGGAGAGIIGAGRKKKVVPLVTVEEPIKMVEKKPAGKIQARRKTIGFREMDEDMERSRKSLLGQTFSPVREFIPEASLAIKKKEEVGKVSKERTNVGGVEGAKLVGRQKRVSAEKLYYWSSSSSADEESAAAVRGGATDGANGKLGPTSGEPDEGDEDDDNNIAMEQHGWIVGGSHKKLVTLLAHAKGKKSDVALKK